ncbi:hypothetical protein [Shewanella algae]|uniref:hypothetical protein n=1 Tax=Shewanella algae TaxID=38313 RepID=UPI0031F4E415
MSNTRLSQYQAWLESVTDAGFNVIEFKTPCCDSSLKTIAPEKGGCMWDSFAVCPHCSEPFFKEVYSDRVVVKRINHPSTNLKTA